MKWLTIEYIRKHSRIDSDVEDELLELYGESAEDTVLNIVGDSYEQIVLKYDGMPKALYHAALMLVDVGYQYRSPVTPANTSMVPYTFDLLVKPYMRLAGSANEDIVDGMLMSRDDYALAGSDGDILTVTIL